MGAGLRISRGKKRESDARLVGGDRPWLPTGPFWVQCHRKVRDGRLLGVVDALPGVLAYGHSRNEAIADWRIADMLEAGELPNANHVEFEHAA